MDPLILRISFSKYEIFIFKWIIDDVVAPKKNIYIFQLGVLFLPQKMHDYSFSCTKGGGSTQVIPNTWSLNEDSYNTRQLFTMEE